jgi:hypothetical protein
MFELADHLVGIYKVEDCTLSVTIENLDKTQNVIGNTQQSTINSTIDANEETVAMETEENEIASKDLFDQVAAADV